MILIGRCKNKRLHRIPHSNVTPELQHDFVQRNRGANVVQSYTPAQKWNFFGGASIFAEYGVVMSTKRMKPPGHLNVESARYVTRTQFSVMSFVLMQLVVPGAVVVCFVMTTATCMPLMSLIRVRFGALVQ